METLDRQFGAPTSLEDFERKAQMMNYVTYRALFEGFFAHLWTKNSGRLLWMTHPAWPSHAWQIYSSDYDTHAAYYGTKKANETIHVQMNLPDYQLAVINNALTDLPNLTLSASVRSLDNAVLLEAQETLHVRANAVMNATQLELPALLDAHGMVFVKLVLKDASGRVLSENFYWEGRDESALRKLNDLPRAPLRLTATRKQTSDEVVVQVTLENSSNAAALANKLTLLDAKGARILPAYYSDNYVSLLPGERREIEVRYPASKYTGIPTIALRGWNAAPATISAR